MELPEDSDLDPDYQSVDPIVGLTDRERRFGDAYFDVSLTHGDSSAALLLAYRRAFPLAENTDRSAMMLARGLIKSSRVQALVTRLRQELSRRRSLPAERVIQELERIAYSNILDYMEITSDGRVSFNVGRLTPATSAAVQEVTITEDVIATRDRGNEIVSKRQIKIRLCDKLSALDKLARFHNLLRDRRFSLEELDRIIREMEQKVNDRLPLTHVTIDGGSPDHAQRPLVSDSDSPSDGKDRD